MTRFAETHKEAGLLKSDHILSLTHVQGASHAVVFSPRDHLCFSVLSRKEGSPYWKRSSFTDLLHVAEEFLEARLQESREEARKAILSLNGEDRTGIALEQCGERFRFYIISQDGETGGRSLMDVYESDSFNCPHAWELIRQNHPEVNWVIANAGIGKWTQPDALTLKEAALASVGE